MYELIHGEEIYVSHKAIQHRYSPVHADSFGVAGQAETTHCEIGHGVVQEKLWGYTLKIAIKFYSTKQMAAVDCASHSAIGCTRKLLQQLSTQLRGKTSCERYRLTLLSNEFSETSSNNLLGLEAALSSYDQLEKQRPSIQISHQPNPQSSLMRNISDLVLVKFLCEEKYL